MATKTLFFRNAAFGVPVTGSWKLSETQGGATDDATTQHTGDGTANTFVLLKPGVSLGSTTNTVFDTAAPPAVGNRFGWFSDTAYTGTFAAGNWTVTFREDSTSNTSGFPKLNIYRCTTQDFTGSFVFIGTVTGAQWWTNNTSSVTGTLNPGAVTLNNEFLFVNLWCNETVTISNKRHNFHTEGTTSQSQILTTSFSSTAAVTPLLMLMGCGT